MEGGVTRRTRRTRRLEEDGVEAEDAGHATGRDRWKLLQRRQRRAAREPERRQRSNRKHKRAPEAYPQ